MKKCPYCGKEYPDDAEVCAVDQSPLTETAPALSPSPPPPPDNRFLKWIATFSLLAPGIVILIYISLILYFQANGKASPMLFVVVGLLIMLLLVSGFVLGIVALVAVKPQQRKGVFGKAIAGTCLNGIFLALLIIGPLMLAHVLKNKFPNTPQERYSRATNALARAENHFYALDDAAKEGFNTGHIEEARKYATNLLALAPGYLNDWNYGNAIQDGNLVLGRIALREGKVEEARQYLLAAGQSKGSPQMNSFGPNMSLAKDLLEKGERDTVLQYFEFCRKFWKMDNGKLDRWSEDVRAGRIPDFGANLLY
jgi:hypothetical protein